MVDESYELLDEFVSDTTDKKHAVKIKIRCKSRGVMTTSFIYLNVIERSHSEIDCCKTQSEITLPPESPDF
jgi:hypothetical protein